MDKIETKLLEHFNQNKNYESTIDKIVILSKNNYTVKDYFYYNSIVYSKTIDKNYTKIFFYLPSFDSVLLSRINLFLKEYELKIEQINNKYFCAGKEIKLDTIFYVLKNIYNKYTIV